MTQDTADSSPVPARVVIGSIAVLWICYFVLATLRGAVMGYELDWPMVSRRLAVTAGSMAATALLWPLLHQLHRKSLKVMAAAALLASLPVSVLLAAINVWIFADIEEQWQAAPGKDQRIDIRRDSAGSLLVDIGDPAKPRPSAAATQAPEPEPSPSAEPLPPGEAHKRPVIIIKRMEDEEGSSLVHQLTELSLGRYFLLLAWAAIYLALAKAEQARTAERREGEYRRAAKAAELRSLRYQINPHFLFNTLNSLSALVLAGRSDSAERMIHTLSTFYRRTLAEEPTADHRLDEEVELQKLYLDIERVRFPDRLRVECAIPPELAGCLVPGMILQPLVENAVKYAVAPSRRAVTVTIAAHADGGSLVLVVSDDGPGVPGDQGGGTGIGLANVRERLEARFGAAGQVTSGAGEGGFRVELRMPIVRSNG